MTVILTETGEQVDWVEEDEDDDDEEEEDVDEMQAIPDDESPLDDEPGEVAEVVMTFM